VSLANLAFSVLRRRRVHRQLEDAARRLAHAHIAHRDKQLELRKALLSRGYGSCDRLFDEVSATARELDHAEESFRLAVELAA
jgi:hypothetical protein